jgi:HEPN domain-containing protein
LTGYAVETRYPGLSEDVTKEDYVQALELADRVVQWVESLLLPRSGLQKP